MTEINYTARKIKKIYELFRKRSTPQYFCGSKFDEDWFKLANLTKSLKACPIIYLESLFEDWGGIPYPHQLCSIRAQQIYKKYIEKGQTIGEKEFTHQINFMHECVKFYAQKNINTDPVNQILLLDFIPIKAYIRVLLCGDEILPQILEKYGSLACAEIKSNPSMDKYLKENYVSRYQRLFPQRLSKIDSSSHDALPEPTSTSSLRKNIPKRRRLAHS